MAEQPEEGTRLTAAQIHANVLRPAELEIRRPAAALLLSALAAGLVIGFSCLAAAFAASAVPGPYKHAAAAAAYPLGFIFVIMARSELFTENTLVPVVRCWSVGTSPHCAWWRGSGSCCWWAI